ncbi:hypothetical protein ABMA27_001303 [Loxostege sticticalis]|uniref:FLYWCH-type domain-containing protein n=1 Tax=Loxostege sticticalis TaxID=481309 RepID=A0ABR3HXZ5_LOXSC
MALTSKCKSWSMSLTTKLKLITISSTGKQYIMRDGYTYYRHLAMKVGFRWSCTHSSRCNARIIVDDNGRVLSTNGEHLHPPPKFYVSVQIITLSSGKTCALYQGYTFFKHYQKKEGFSRWTCTAYSKCKSYIVLDRSLNLVSTSIAHTHEKKMLVFSAKETFKLMYLKHIWLLTDLSFITTVDDKCLFHYQGYLYTKAPYSKYRWRCINTNNCFVSMLVDNDGSLRKEPNFEHTHLPKRLVLTKTGKYLILKDRK